MKVCSQPVLRSFSNPDYYSSLHVIQDVGELVSSLEQICRNVVLCHLLTNGSFAVNGCSNQQQVIHTPLQSINSYILK